MVKKIIFVIFLSIILLGSIGFSKTYAAKDTKDTVDTTIEGADNFLEKGGSSVINEETLKEASDFVFNAFLAVAIVIVVIVGMIIGIKFMMAGIEEKAELKETLVPYFWGCIVVFGAFGIWKLVVTILSEF